MVGLFKEARRELASRLDKEGGASPHHGHGAYHTHTHGGAHGHTH